MEYGPCSTTVLCKSHSTGHITSMDEVEEARMETDYKKFNNKKVVYNSLNVNVEYMKNTKRLVCE